MARDYPRGFKPKIQAHEMPEILRRFSLGADWGELGSSWGPLTALQVGQATHRANSLRCRSCLELDASSGDLVTCPISDHHFLSEQCEFCVEDGIMALDELAEKGLVELSGTPTEKAKELNFDLEAAELLDPPRKRKKVRASE